MFLANKLLGGLDKFFEIFHRYILEIIVLMFVILFSLWTIAFLANGVYQYHFDLQSCWGGFSAIGGAGVLAAVKYCMDSWKNTPQGIAPDYFSNAITKVTDSITKR